MEHQEKVPTSTYDVYFKTNASSGAENYELTPAQRAAAAETVANNFDGPLMAVTEAVAQIEIAAEVGDVIEWRVAKNRADAALRRAEQFAIAAGKAGL